MTIFEKKNSNIHENMKEYVSCNLYLFFEILSQKIYKNIRLMHLNKKQIISLFELHTKTSLTRNKKENERLKHVISSRVRLFSIIQKHLSKIK